MGEKIKDIDEYFYFVVYFNEMVCFLKAKDLQIGEKKSVKGLAKGK